MTSDTDLKSFCDGLERAAQFHEEQAFTCELAIKAEFPSKYRAEQQRVAKMWHDWCAKALRGMKRNYETGNLKLTAEGSDARA